MSNPYGGGASSITVTDGLAFDPESPRTLVNLWDTLTQKTNLLLVPPAPLPISIRSPFLPSRLTSVECIIQAAIPLASFYLFIFLLSFYLFRIFYFFLIVSSC